MDRFGFDLELKTVDVSERIIEGYAAIADTVDRVNDVIDKKAFDRVQTQPPGNVAVFVGHDMSKLPVGIPLEIRYDGKGLWTKTKIFSTHAGDDLLAVASELKQHGKTLGQSIGYKVMPNGAMRDKVEGKTVRRLLDLDIKEYSYAASQTIAHPDALVTGVKAMSEGMDSAGGYLTQEIVNKLRDEHKLRCTDKDCPLKCHDDDAASDTSDTDGSKSEGEEVAVKAEVEVVLDEAKVYEWLTKCVEDWQTLRTKIDAHYAEADSGEDAGETKTEETIENIGGKTLREWNEYALDMVDIDLVLANAR